MTAAGGGEGETGIATAADTMLDEVWEGLNRDRKVISSKYFYDERGSELFVEITRLPEYYPTRTERALLEEWSPRLIRRYAPATLLELGAGSAGKTRILLDAMAESGEGGLYIPQDVSTDFVLRTAETLREEYPDLQVEPLAGDLVHPLDPALDVPRPLLLAFLGSTIGNFSTAQNREIMENIAAYLKPEDRFLLGCDLRPSEGKPLAELEAAYNDSRGVTAEFNRNVLSVLNTLLATDFQPSAFRHRAFYNAQEGRIEMHLVADTPQVVTVPDRGEVRFRAGESVRTEISCKYDRETVEELFAHGGLALEEWITDARGRYALAVARLP